MDEAIDRFWDQVAQGRADTAGDLDPADTAAIRHLHAHDDRPLPRPAFTRHLREELMHAHAIQVSEHPRRIPAPKRPLQPPLADRPQAPHAPRRRELAQFATAALVILTLVGSFFVFGPGRHARPEEERSFLPAIGATPATLDAAAPIAEFVWQADTIPDRPFGELGRPAVDPAGNLWIADATYGQYLIFAPDGTFLETWGMYGSDEGEFSFACAAIPVWQHRLRRIRRHLRPRLRQPARPEVRPGSELPHELGKRGDRRRPVPLSRGHRR